MTPHIKQTPAPGDHLLRFNGDRVVFTLQVIPARTGKAFVRTNLGHAPITRREIIRHVEHNESRLGRDWFDIPMSARANGCFEAAVDLSQVGHFEAKCFFLSRGQGEPLWPAGENTVINVEPADTCCGNILYNAFVRQFGPNKMLPASEPADTDELIKPLDQAGFTVIPPSGKFRDLIAELDFIMKRLGCRVLQLLPIHPTPTTYARMGRFGSPYASLSFTAVDRALAVFDPKATPLEQFLELVDAVHARHGKIIIDIAINHTGWAAGLHETHPQWLCRNHEGEIQTPGAWGVVWADLTRLDYRHKEMWTYMADVFLTWCRRGVDGFRCDAGYMIPTPAWQYLIAKVRDQYPDTLFLLEGLGGKISVTRDLLNRANFNWAYSELFQNYDRSQIHWYLPGANEISESDGLTVHFAETHDNNRLAATSKAYARMRTALCALTAPCGVFAFTNGVEWLATEKINVHEARALNWGATDNQVETIARLSALLKTHPLFGHRVSLDLITEGQGEHVVLRRKHRETGQWLIVVVNLDWRRPATAAWRKDQAHFTSGRAVDLISARQVGLQTTMDQQHVSLDPGQVLCLAPEDDSPQAIGADPPLIPPAAARQRLRAKVLESLHALSGIDKRNETADRDPDADADRLADDPEAFCADMNTQSAADRVVRWSFPEDLRRVVMAPPGHFLLLHAPHPFQARLTHDNRMVATEHSMSDRRDAPFILLTPLPTPRTHRFYDLEVIIHDPAGTVRATSRLLFLANGKNTTVRTTFNRNDCHHIPLLMLATDGRGAMLRTHIDWQRLDSRYDALLAANIDPRFPEDRWIMLSRCRAWVIYQGFSQDVKLDSLERFSFHHTHGGCWIYRLPTGQGEHVGLRVTIQMLKEKANSLRIHVHRLSAASEENELADDKAITFVLRPDIESRNFHHSTKAYTGPEHLFAEAVRGFERGFSFAPDPDRRLVMQADQGRFSVEPEWYYMVHRPLEAERGLDAHSDLFGPGYFSCALRGGESVTFSAGVNSEHAREETPRHSQPDCGLDAMEMQTALTAALEHYVVRRGDFNTVIAGYPWFLDWGRDTLIAVRGLVAAGRLKTAQNIIRQFAGFESHGTLPNMIRGNDASNRDTSDGPLWLFTACADLAAALKNRDFLNDDCGGRSLGQVLIDLAGAIITGTPNGIRMDPDSGLVYSPSHFTWMDTNHPAGTPRQGYPIEIQALWHAALVFLTAADQAGAKQWKTVAAKVRQSIVSLFWQPDLGFLTDCRHAPAGRPAAQAEPDDALRPNQLLAITLGAVTDNAICRSVLKACQVLLAPGAIRSLADRPVRVPLEIRRDGQLLNNPRAPYQGTYAGDEDTRRKPAYHNGTAWTWLFPSFCEAWAMCYGPAEHETALSWLSSSVELINGHCVGQVPEIVDGDAPHRQRGCDAQAWGVSELLRVWKRLSDDG